MLSQETKNKIAKEDDLKYDSLPPDGGWGYVVAIAVGVVFIATCLPMAAFGIIFGNFLSTLGDPTSGTALANGFFNTTFSFTGLIANVLLNMFSYIKVGLLGAVIFSIGTIGVIFSNNLVLFIFSYGIVEGFGYGILLPVVLTALNAYFDKKLTLMMSLSQGILVIGNMTSPLLFQLSSTELGYRGTLIVLSGLSLLAFPAVFTLQPASKHMRKIRKEVDIEDVPKIDPPVPSKKYSTSSRKNTSNSKNSLEKRHRKRSLLVEYSRDPNRKISGAQTRPNLGPMGHKISIVSIGDRGVIPVDEEVEIKNEEDKSKSFLTNLKESVDLSLFKEPKFINISVGLALAYAADMSFNPIIPTILTDLDFTDDQAAFLTFVFFASDLTSRTILIVVSGFVRFSNRKVLLGACCMSMIFRVVFVLYNTYYWKLVNLAILGFFRTYLQALLPMVCSDEYPDQFSTAFTLYMAVNGVISLICGVSMSVIKSVTKSDVFVCHFLTGLFFLMVFSWVIELIVTRKKGKKEPNRVAQVTS